MPTNYWLKFGNSTCGFNGSGVQFEHVEQPGTLTVGVSLGGSGYDPSKTFAFTVTFGTAIVYSVDGVPVSTASDTYVGSLADGGTVVLGNIPFGTTYAVTEATLGQQDIDAGYSNGSVTGASGTMTDAGYMTATAHYSYTEPPAVSPILHFHGSASSVRYQANFYRGSSRYTTGYTIYRSVVDTGTGSTVTGLRNGWGLSVSNPDSGQITVTVIRTSPSTYSPYVYSYNPSTGVYTSLGQINNTNLVLNDRTWSFNGTPVTAEIHISDYALT